MRYILITFFSLLLTGCGFSQSFVGISPGPGIHFYNVNRIRDDVTNAHSKGFYTVGLDFKFGEKLLFVVNPSYSYEIMYYRVNYTNHTDESTIERHMNYFLHYLALSVYPELLLPGKKAYMKAGLQARILIKAKRKEIAYHKGYYPKPYSYKTKETA